MRSNSKFVRVKIQKHILDCVYDCQENYFTDIKDSCNYLYIAFNRATNYPYYLNRFPNHQDRFSDYLNGVPFHFYYTNDDILQFIQSLCINTKQYDIDKTVKYYHYLIYCEMIKNIDR